MTSTIFQGIEKQVFILVFFFSTALIAGIFSCKNQAAQPGLQVVLPHTALLDAPGERGRELRSLAARDRLTDLELVSGFETQLRIGDQSLIAPWIQVQTVDGTIGWVFSGAVKPEQADEHWLLDKRMRCYLGPELCLRRNRWLATQPNTADETDFAVFYHEALALRDTFTFHLAHRSEPNAADIQPDFLWLREALPGFIYQRVAQGTQPYLFTDYRFFRAMAMRSTGHQDDQLIETYLAAYPTDSIESIAPVWVKQVGDNEVVSQLGLGHHQQLLALIEKGLSRPNGLFQTDFLALKEMVLDDMLGKDVRYWQPEEKILAELEKILGSSLTSLTAADREALARRLAMFQSPAENGLRVNLRAGE